MSQLSALVNAHDMVRAAASSVSVTPAGAAMTVLPLSVKAAATNRLVGLASLANVSVRRPMLVLIARTEFATRAQIARTMENALKESASVVLAGLVMIAQLRFLR